MELLVLNISGYCFADRNYVFKREMNSLQTNFDARHIADSIRLVCN